MTESPEQFEKCKEWAEALEHLLPDIASQLPDRSEDQLAKLCGFFSTEFYKEALAQAIQEKKESGDQPSDSSYSFFVYTKSGSDYLVYTDEQMFGQVYVPERLIKADPDFYDFNDWEPMNKGYLKDLEGWEDEEIIEFLEDFPEPMMRKYIATLSPCDDEARIYPDEMFEAEAQGVRYGDIFDVGGCSRWGDS